MTTAKLTLRAADGAISTLAVPLPIAASSVWWHRPAGPAWTGQPNLNTGWQNLPGGPASLKVWPGGTITSGGTYSGFDFTTPGLQIGSGSTPVHDVKFVGCRFIGPKAGNSMVSVFPTGTGVEFDYCTFQPNLTFTPGIGNTMPVSAVYQYGILSDHSSNTGNMTVSHCDFWGGENLIDMAGTGQTLIDHCWFHDQCTTDPLAHVDGVGNLNGGINASNVTVSYCTIEGKGNTNAIAFQGCPGGYHNMSFVGNYLGGYGYTVFIDGAHGTDTIQFTDNIFSTEFTPDWGPLYNTAFVSTPGSKWARNRWHSLDPVTGGNLGWGTKANDGKFWLPVTSNSTNDSAYVGTADHAAAA